MTSAPQTVGNLAVNEEKALSPFLVDIDPNAPTPRWTRVLAQINDATETWETNIPLTIVRSYSVAGHVALDGAPLAGATVTFDGPMKGAVTTGSDGAYRLVLTPGSYLVRVTKGELLAAGTTKIVIENASMPGFDFAFTTARNRSLGSWVPWTSTTTLARAVAINNCGSILVIAYTSTLGPNTLLLKPREPVCTR